MLDGERREQPLVGLGEGVRLGSLERDDADDPSPARSARRARTRVAAPPTEIAPARIGSRRSCRVRSGRRVGMTRDVSPSPSSIGSCGSARRSSISYGNVISSVVCVVERDEQSSERRRSRATRSPTSSMIASKSSCLAERRADLVDDRQLGVALPRLLDGTGADERGADVLRDEDEQVDVLARVAPILAIGLDGDDPDRPAIGLQRHAQPLDADLARGSRARPSWRGPWSFVRVK